MKPLSNLQFFSLQKLIPRKYSLVEAFSRIFVRHVIDTVSSFCIDRIDIAEVTGHWNCVNAVHTYFGGIFN